MRMRTQKVIDGLTVAFLDGTYNAPAFNSPEPHPQHYNRADLELLKSQLQALDGGEAGQGRADMCVPRSKTHACMQSCSRPTQTRACMAYVRGWGLGWGAL